MTKHSNIYLTGGSSTIRDLLRVLQGQMADGTGTNRKQEREKGKTKGKCGKEINMGKRPGTKRSDGLQEAELGGESEVSRPFPKK